MKPFLSARLLPTLTLAIAIFSMLGLNGCATTDYLFKQSKSSLPIEVTHQGRGKILSFRAYETPERLYVSGSAKKFPLSSVGHVDIQLVGSTGHVLTEKQDDIEPTAFRRGGARQFTDIYVASFPLSEARQAARIRIVYHTSKHS